MRRILVAPVYGTFDLDAGSAQVHISVDESCEDVEIVLSASGSEFEEAAALAAVSGSKLTIPAVDDVTAGHVSANCGGRSYGENLRVDLLVPRQIRIGAIVRVGDIAAFGLLADANLRTDAGSIEVDHIEGFTVLKASVGDISINSADGTVYATASGGHITAVGVSGVAVLNTSVGDIHVQADLPEMVSASTSGGNIDILGYYDKQFVTAITNGGRVRYH